MVTTPHPLSLGSVVGAHPPLLKDSDRPRTFHPKHRTRLRSERIEIKKGERFSYEEVGVRDAAGAPAGWVRWILASGPGLPGDRVLAADEHVAEVERGVALGVVRALVRPAALGARERAAGDQPGQRVRVLRAAGSSPRCVRTMPASRHSAARVAGVGDRWRGELAQRLHLPLARRGERRARTATARRRRRDGRTRSTR